MKWNEWKYEHVALKFVTVNVNTRQMKVSISAYLRNLLLKNVQMYSVIEIYNLQVPGILRLTVSSAVEDIYCRAIQYFPQY